MEKSEFELTLADRLGVIRDTLRKHGAWNFYLSFSGGKDSTVLSRLLDEALPGNLIPRVFVDTGIEYEATRKFVLGIAKRDGRFRVVRPSMPIVPTLNEFGYPFKNKEHSKKLHLLQSGSPAPSVERYFNGSPTWSCPKSLRCQAEPGYPLKVSDECCKRLKKAPARRWEKSSGIRIAILGVWQAEGGQRGNHGGGAVRYWDGTPREYIAQMREARRGESPAVKLWRIGAKGKALILLV